MLNHSHSTARKTLFLCAGIFLTSIIVRIITAEYIDIGGDNSEKWRQVHYLIEGLGYTHWYQQTVRWGIMLPLAGLMKTFGLNPASLYILPIFFSSMAASFIFLIGRRLHSLALGIVAAGATILFPQMVQTGSQLWPGVFELGYLSLCTWLILIWIDNRQTSILLLAAIAFFMGWGCRVSMIYAAPGLALLIWLPTRSFKSLCIFFLTLAAFFLIEWGAFWLITGNPMGRIGVLKETHLQTAGLSLSWTHYLLNFTKLVKLKGLVAIWALCFLSSTYVAITGSARWRALASLYLVYAILLLYMVSSISPLKLAMPVGTRFWGVIAPFGLIILIKSLFDLKAKSPRTALSLMGVLFAVFLAFTVKKIPAVNSIYQLNKDYALLTPILAARQPILMHYEHWQPNFLEEHIISLFTKKKGKRIPREDHVIAAMVRNHHRMVALFATDLGMHDEYKQEERLKPVGYTSYMFIPAETAPDAQPAAEIRFGRKHHSAIPLPGTKAKE